MGYGVLHRYVRGSALVFLSMLVPEDEQPQVRTNCLSSSKLPLSAERKA